MGAPWRPAGGVAVAGAGDGVARGRSRRLPRDRPCQGLRLLPAGPPACPARRPSGGRGRYRRGQSGRPGPVAVVARHGGRDGGQPVQCRCRGGGVRRGVRRTRPTVAGQGGRVHDGPGPRHGGPHEEAAQQRRRAGRHLRPGRPRGPGPDRGGGKLLRHRRGNAGHLDRCVEWRPLRPPGASPGAAAQHPGAGPGGGRARHLQRDARAGRRGAAHPGGGQGGRHHLSGA